MIEINLVPDVKQELLKAQRVRSTVIAFSILIGIISIAVVVLLSIYVFGIQKVRDNMANDEIKKGIAKLQSVKDLSKTLTIQKQLSKIESLNNNKKIDSRIFEVLGAVVPPDPNDIQFSKIEIDSEMNLIKLEAQAENSYDALQTFEKTLEGAKLEITGLDGKVQKDLITLASNINKSGISYGQSTNGSRVLNFTMSFNYAPELFSPLIKSILVKITVNGNVTDSYLGIPKTLFTDPILKLEEE